MMNHQIHEPHEHVHHNTCGHKTIQHEDHRDFLHNGHMHHLHNEHIDEHILSVTDQNPFICTPSHFCGGHDKLHIHGPNCGHEAIPHAEHIDYLVNGHLHFVHDNHCDNHGIVNVA